jgi:threonine/homoserine/homoserine lactone efflux protein
MQPMVSSSHFFIFLASAALLAVSPGPGLLYVLARTLRGGRRVGLASSFGTAAGGVAHVVAAGFGLSVVLARSASAFLVVKYAGAAYLVWLGARSLLEISADGSPSDQTGESVKTVPTGSPFWQGVVTEALNSKTALFFLAFIPQFVSHDAPLVPQFILLGVISVALNTSADIAVVLLAGPLQRRLTSSRLWRRRQQQATGIALIGLGGYVGASSQ